MELGAKDIFRDIDHMRIVWEHIFDFVGCNKWPSISSSNAISSYSYGHTGMCRGGEHRGYADYVDPVSP